MTVSIEPRTTLSLAAAGGSALFPIASYRLIGIKLSAGNVTAEGTLSFRLANDSEDPTPNAMADPTVAVVAGVAVNEFVNLVDIAANYIQVYWTPTAAEAVDLEILIGGKR